jgi:hypothetical protein
MWRLCLHVVSAVAYSLVRAAVVCSLVREMRADDGMRTCKSAERHVYLSDR